MRFANHGAPLLVAAFVWPSVVRVEEARTAAAVRVAVDTVVAITPPAVPLPPELASAGVTRFSFIAYGDTRGDRDGVALQGGHSLVVEAMLAKIATMSHGPDPVRFVLQSGDGVANGRIAAQWNVSYVPLINRLTTEAGVSYFLATGNHDVTGSPRVGLASRDSGLRNYFAANAALLPPNGSPRRLKDYPAFGFGFGNSFFLSFDSNITDDSTQFRFVRQQLEGLDRVRYPNVVVFFHHPPFSSGPHGGPKLEPQATIIRSLYMPLFRRHHVRLLLTGHEHLFEHWIERYVDEAGPHRMDEIVSGGGGAPKYEYTGEPDLSTYVAANAAQHVTLEHFVTPSATAAANLYHFVVVHVNGEQITTEVVAAEADSSFAPYHGGLVRLADKEPRSY